MVMTLLDANVHARDSASDTRQRSRPVEEEEEIVTNAVTNTTIAAPDDLAATVPAPSMASALSTIMPLLPLAVKGQCPRVVPKILVPLGPCLNVECGPGNVEGVFRHQSVGHK